MLSIEGQQKHIGIKCNIKTLLGRDYEVEKAMRFLKEIRDILKKYELNR